MRKLLILLSVVLLGTTMFSCMDPGEESRSGQGPFYVANVEGERVAYNGAVAISSPEIESKTTNGWYILSWSWSTQMGVTDKGYLKASVGQIEAIRKGEYRTTPVAEGEMTTPLKSFGVVSGVPMAKEYGNELLFSYEWDKADGEVGTLVMIPVEDKTSTGSFLYDVRLNKEGTAKGEAKAIAENVSINFTNLREKLTFREGAAYETISVRFRYYSDADGTLKESNPVQIIVYK